MRIERGQIAADIIGKHYTQIFNGALRDPRISWKSKGILCWMLSHSEGFSTSIEAIVAAGPDGREAVRTALIELEEFGYIKRGQERIDGKLGKSTCKITDMPKGLKALNTLLTEISGSVTDGKKPSSGPSSGNRTSGMTRGFTENVSPWSDFLTTDEPTTDDPPHKKTTFEEDHVSPEGETGEEHSLRSRSEAALSGGACAPGGGSDDLLDRLLAEFAPVDGEAAQPDGGAAADPVVNLPGGGALIRGTVVGPAADVAHAPEKPSVAARGFNGHVPGCCCPDCLRSRQAVAQGASRGFSVPPQPDGNRRYDTT